jgi:hypothetical protein
MQVDSNSEMLQTPFTENTFAFLDQIIVIIF